MMVQLRQTKSAEKYGNNGKYCYFWFDDDDNKIKYSYVLSVKELLMGQLNTSNTIYCQKINERFDYILHTLWTEYMYTQQAFVDSSRYFTVYV